MSLYILGMTEAKNMLYYLTSRSNNKERPLLRETFPKKEKILKFFQGKNLT